MKLEDIATPIETPKFDLSIFSITGNSKEMNKSRLDEKYIAGKLALLGQLTVFYAAPNTGKTLITMKLLCDAIRNQDIKGEDVYYINADDSLTGLYSKLKVAEEYGFNILAPDYGANDYDDNVEELEKIRFKSKLLPQYLDQMKKDKTAHGKVLILDTLKKFTDLMNKKNSSEFNTKLREFSAVGGTVIALAHVNKRKGDDGLVIHAGTSDTLDDFDCGYTIQEVECDSKAQEKTVIFRNLKARGDNAKEVSYSYSIEEGLSYDSRLASIYEVNAEKLERLNAQQEKFAKENKYKRIIEVITDTISTGVDSRTELIKQAHTILEIEGISKVRITKVLDDFDFSNSKDNAKWKRLKQGKNKIVYELL